MYYPEHQLVDDIVDDIGSISIDQLSFNLQVSEIKVYFCLS